MANIMTPLFEPWDYFTWCRKNTSLYVLQHDVEMKLE